MLIDDDNADLLKQAAIHPLRLLFQLVACRADQGSGAEGRAREYVSMLCKSGAIQ